MINNLSNDAKNDSVYKGFVLALLDTLRVSDRQSRIEYSTVLCLVRNVLKHQLKLIITYVVCS